MERRSVWASNGLLAVGLFLLALIIRVWLAGYSLPYVEHVDEPAVIEVAIRMVRDGDLNPHTFRYPSLTYDLFAATTRLHLWWGLATGLYHTSQDIPFKNNGVTSAPILFIWARTLTALLGAATVPALFALGQRMFDRRVGLLAALILLFTSFHIRHSHFITVDVPTGLWVVLIALGAWEIASSGRWRGYLLAGVALGLAAGTKYNAATVVLIIPVAHLCFWRRASFGLSLMRLVAAAALSGLTFLATTPYALLDSAAFLRDLSFNSYHYNQAEHGDFVGRWPVADYAWFFWDESLYAPGVVALLAGLIPLARRFRAQVALLSVASIPPILLLLNYGTHFTRNLLPVLPLLILLVAAGGLTLVDVIAKRLPPRFAPAILAACCAALLLPHVYATYQHLDYWSRTHSMVQASDRLKELPQGARIAAELPATLFGGYVAIYPVKRITEQPLAWYRANGFRYLAVNDDLRTAEDSAAYTQLKDAATVVVAYPPRRAAAQPGPSGAILDLGIDPAQLLFVRHHLRFGDQIELLGYEIQPGEPRARSTPLAGADTRTLSAGQPVQINLYWRGLQAMDSDYTLFVHVLNGRGERVAQRDMPLRYEDYPTSHWQPGELVIDRADLPLPSLPPGTYRLELGLYDAASGAQLPLGGPAAAPLTVEVR